VHAWAVEHSAVQTTSQIISQLLGLHSKAGVFFSVFLTNDGLLLPHNRETSFDTAFITLETA